MSVNGFDFDGTVHRYNYNSLDNIPPNIAPAYSASSTYAVGDYCTKDNVLYKCSTAISTAEAWNSAHWSQVQLATDVADLKDDLMQISDVSSSEEISVNGFSNDNNTDPVLANAPFVLSNSSYNYTGCLVKKIKLKVKTAGTLSIGTIKKSKVVVGQSFNRNDAVVKEVLSIANTGILEINITSPFPVASDEYLFIGMPTDTCMHYYGQNGIDKIFMYANQATGKWGQSSYSLGINITVDKNTVIGKATSRFYGKKLSIIGDSIDTFDQDGYKIPGYNMWYPSGTVTNVEQTWWKKVINASGMMLEVNASWSGSRVTNTHPNPSYPDFYDRVSVIGNPDVIFVTLGTNDWGGSVALGEYDFTSAYTSLSESTFRTAYIKGVKALKALYPNAQIVCISQKMSNSYRESIIHIADVLECAFIDASDYIGENDVHPGESGMRQIASLVLYPTDESLTQKHIPADAKETGDRIRRLNKANSIKGTVTVINGNTITEDYDDGTKKVTEFSSNVVTEIFYDENDVVDLVMTTTFSGNTITSVVS